MTILYLPLNPMKRRIARALLASLPWGFFVLACFGVRKCSEAQERRCGAVVIGHTLAGQDVYRCADGR